MQIKLDDQGGGKAAIFFEEQHWKRLPTEDSSDAPAQWFRWRDTADRPAAVSGKMGRLLERIYRHPETARTVHRFPFPRLPKPQSAEDLAAAERIEDRVAELDATVLRSMTRRRELSIEVGRAFNELKAILGHGKWQHHFAETFAPCGISLRTAERWMKRATKTDADSKNDTMSIFKSANDRGAREIMDATEQAQAEIAASSGHIRLTKKPRLYRLPLRMTDDERNAMDSLRESPNWPRAERRILHLLRRLWVRYDIVESKESS